ncbi:MAG: hypothetical protein HZB55_11120 [Deltaproteobacteria bacterium]|nr:hypothetical protein [Deltaproteobacteria bacterium]
MNVKLGAAVFAGVFAVAAALPLSALAGRGRGPAAQTSTQTQATTQTRDGIQTRQRLRDGSCNPDCPNAAAGQQMKRGNTYGPGDGTGNGGTGPQDGTGYGAPSQR